jgi:hypothetical protein
MKNYALPARENRVKHLAIIGFSLTALMWVLAAFAWHHWQKQSSGSDYKNYEAYFQKHGCRRQLEEKQMAFKISYRAYIHCTNGVWREEDFIKVANGRLPG